MNIEAYIKGSKRGDFTWEIVESGEYGDGNSIDIEETILDGRQGKVTRNSSTEYQAEVENLKHDPYYDINYFSSRRNARSWSERMIKKDIKQ